MVVIVAGRPLLLGQVLDQADAVVMAWLPGTEGAGITDALFGDQPLNGKLPFAWPSDSGAALFPRGYGLTK